MLTYYKPICTQEGYTLSVDKMVVDYYISSPAARDGLARLLNRLPMRYAVQVSAWDSSRIGTFRRNCTITFQDRNSFWIGVGLNAAKPNYGRVRLEANPNKCANHTVFLALLSYLNQNSRPMHTSIRRFDLAVDLPVSRPHAHLIKDHRAYSEIRKSRDDYTQYLGPKSSVGRVKLYNKTLEAGLDVPVTRLELTLAPLPYAEVNFPRVYVIQTQQIGMDELRLTDTERFILGAILEGYGNITYLGTKTRAKMEQALNEYVTWVTVSPKDYNLILSRLHELLHYPRIDPKLDWIDPDQPPAPPAPPPPSWVQEAGEAVSTNGVPIK